MDDKKFQSLGIEARLAPGRKMWPDDIVHWQLLGAAVDKARAAVDVVYSEISAIDANRDLTPAGKDRRRTEAALKAVTELEGDRSIVKARESVDSVLQKWNAKQGAIVKRASDQFEVSLHRELRQFVAAQKNKISFIEKHKGDLNLLSALLTVPGYLSSLTEAEFNVVRSMAESHLDPKITEAKAATVKAMAETEHATTRAVELIAEKANLQRGKDGAWVAPQLVKAA